MGVHSAFFGPSKYGLLPELLPERKLSWGNGLLELGTFMAIILGTVAAAWMSKHFHGHQAWSGVILIALAVFGLPHEPRHHPRARRRSRPEIPREFSERLVGATPAGSPRPRRSRSPFSATPISSSWAQLLQLNVFFYGARRPAPGRNRHRPVEHCPRARHRPGQRGRRLSFRRQNRIRPGAARRRWHVAGFRRGCPCRVCP